jgi:hypothetical protein
MVYHLSLNILSYSYGSDIFDIFQEINPADGAQEPGRSYGGACCNSFLKVLYDAESEEIPADQGQLMDTNSLFEEDEDEYNLSEPSPKPFGSLVKGDVTPNKATVTWANLIQKMSEEMQQIGYAQLPTIMSSRKFDLNDSFSLIPDNFDPSINKKRSLLIGCNYVDMRSAQLKASHDDIRSIKVSTGYKYDVQWRSLELLRHLFTKKLYLRIIFRIT